MTNETVGEQIGQLLLCLVINGLCPTWPLAVHSFREEVLNVCSEPEPVLGFRGGKGEDPVNVPRMSCVTFLLGKETVDEIEKHSQFTAACFQ